MNIEKLKEIVKEKNRALEYEATQRARRIIEEIAENNAAISEANSANAKLRAELKTLEVQQLDETSILGG
jgi:hypothetical protein